MSAIMKGNYTIFIPFHCPYTLENFKMFRCIIYHVIIPKGHQHIQKIKTSKKGFMGVYYGKYESLFLTRERKFRSKEQEIEKRKEEKMKDFKDRFIRTLIPLSLKGGGHFDRFSA